MSGENDAAKAQAEKELQELKKKCRDKEDEVANLSLSAEELAAKKKREEAEAKIKAMEDKILAMRKDPEVAKILAERDSRRDKDDDDDRDKRDNGDRSGRSRSRSGSPKRSWKSSKRTRFDEDAAGAKKMGRFSDRPGSRSRSKSRSTKEANGGGASSALDREEGETLSDETEDECFEETDLDEAKTNKNKKAEKDKLTAADPRPNPMLKLIGKGVRQSAVDIEEENHSK